MNTKSVILLMESRMHGDMHVRFGGRPSKTYHREMARRWGSSLLKEIAVRCDIKKPLTTHIARYTYASVVCLANGVTMENVAKMLGHSDTRMTQHYAKVMDSSIKRDMENVARVFNI